MPRACDRRPDPRGRTALLASQIKDAMDVVVIDVTDQHHLDRQRIGVVDGNPYHARSAHPRVGPQTIRISQPGKTGLRGSKGRQVIEATCHAQTDRRVIPNQLM